jgi:hypothetical protein
MSKTTLHPLAQALCDHNADARLAGALLLLAEVDRLTRTKTPQGVPLLRHEYVLDALWLAALAHGGSAGTIGKKLALALDLINRQEPGSAPPAMTPEQVSAQVDVLFPELLQRLRDTKARGGW